MTLYFSLNFTKINLSLPFQLKSQFTSKELKWDNANILGQIYTPKF